jgi:hypothetical protein
MKVSFVITDTKRKSIAFVADTFNTFSLDETIRAVENKLFENMYLVSGTAGTYIRSAPDTKKDNNIDTLSITGPQLIAIAQGIITPIPAIHTYVARYLTSIATAKSFIEPVDSFRIPTKVVQRVFENHSGIIKKAAQEFTIDQYTLGAVLIDEIARLAPFEPIIEKVGVDIIGENTSIGVAQVKIETANDLIKKGIYNPSSGDKKLPFSGNLTNNDRRYLYKYVVQPEHSIRFAAAFIRYVIDFWSSHIDLSNRPEIIGTLYHQGYGDPHAHPESIERGEQIAEEFYPLAKKWID